MSTRSEEAQHEEDRPRPVRFSIFGQIQQQRRDFMADHQLHQLHHHLSIKGNPHGR